MSEVRNRKFNLVGKRGTQHGGQLRHLEKLTVSRSVAVQRGQWEGTPDTLPRPGARPGVSQKPPPAASAY